MASQLKLAEAQFIGYSVGKDNAGIIPLIEGMGLTEKEWLRIRVTMQDWIGDTDIDTIDEYFMKQSKQ